jgi:rubrerythrin
MGTKLHRRARGVPSPRTEEAVQEMGVRVDESAKSTAAASAATLDESGFVDFSVTGTPASGEFRCTDCGYGAVVQRTLPPCPMCGGTVWESRESRASSPVD